MEDSGCNHAIGIRDGDIDLCTGDGLRAAAGGTVGAGGVQWRECLCGVGGGRTCWYER